MTESKRQVPHFYLSTNIEMDVLVDAAGLVNADRPSASRVTITAFVLRAVALALAEHPAFRVRSQAVRR